MIKDSIKLCNAPWYKSLVQNAWCMSWAQAEFWDSWVHNWQPAFVGCGSVAYEWDPSLPSATSRRGQKASVTGAAGQTTAAGFHSPKARRRCSERVSVPSQCPHSVSVSARNATLGRHIQGWDGWWVWKFSSAPGVPHHSSWVDKARTPVGWLCWTLNILGDPTWCPHWWSYVIT